MSANSPTLYTVEYASIFQMLAQQKMSKLAATVTVGGGHVGKQASPVDQFGKIEAAENNGRFEAMPRTDLAYDRRWVFPTNWDINQLQDKNDLLRMMQDPKSAMAMAAVAAFNRRKDRTILEGIFGTNYTGTDGTTSTVFATDMVVSVDEGGAASRLSVAKLRKAKELLMANDLDLDEEVLWCPIDAKAHSALLTEVQITSRDFNDDYVLKDGKINRILGINLVHCERVTEFNGTDDQAGTSTPIPVYAQSGVYFGSWQDVQVEAKERADLRGIPWQLYTKATFGATRLEEDKVVKIWSRP